MSQTWQTLQYLFNLFWISSFGGLSFFKSIFVGRVTSTGGITTGNGDSRSLLKLPSSPRMSFSMSASDRSEEAKLGTLLLIFADFGFANPVSANICGISLVASLSSLKDESLYFMWMTKMLTMSYLKSSLYSFSVILWAFLRCSLRYLTEMLHTRHSTIFMAGRGSGS